MVSCQSSYITLPSSKVRELCLKTINHIDSLRQKDLDEWVESEVINYNNGFFKKLFGLKSITKSDVLARPLGGLADERSWIEIRYWRQYDLAKQLLRACDMAETVNITVSDLESIS